jgi:hypothetical protein
VIGAACQYVQDHYQVPACIGRRVVAYGKAGTIVADRGHYIGVVLDSDSKYRIGNYHPIDGIVYGDMADKLPKRPRRSNYDKFQHDDCGLNFEEWLGINNPQFQERPCTDRMGIEFRMVRYPRSSSYASGRHSIHSVLIPCEYVEVAGDWMANKPEAQASYKTALYAYLAKQRADAKAGIY